jgi:hypothetical protein
MQTIRTDTIQAGDSSIVFSVAGEIHSDRNFGRRRRTT